MLEGDAAFLLEVLYEPAFICNVGDRGVRTVEDAAQYLRARITAQYQRFGFGMWLVELSEPGEPIGICGPILGSGAALLSRRHRGAANHRFRAPLGEARFSPRKQNPFGPRGGGIAPICDPGYLASLGQRGRIAGTYRKRATISSY